jgi:hypothetical protein
MKSRLSQRQYISTDRALLRIIAKRMLTLMAYAPSCQKKADELQERIDQGEL